MKKFQLKEHSLLSQKDIFKISTDIENFHLVMPDYFKSLKVITQTKSEKVVDEKILFLGIPLNVKTKHIIKNPNIHEVQILSGPTKGTVFVEKYDETFSGTIITIDVVFRFSGIFKLFTVLENYLSKKMKQTMKKFVVCAEKYYSTLATRKS